MRRIKPIVLYNIRSIPMYCILYTMLLDFYTPKTVRRLRVPRSSRKQRGTSVFSAHTASPRIRRVVLGFRSAIFLGDNNRYGRRKKITVVFADGAFEIYMK